jgi:hypothetical protein
MARNNPRVQVEDPLRRLPERKVQPLAPDVFVGAPRVEGAGRPLADIADALSSFSGNLGGLARVQAAADKDRADAAAHEFNLLPYDQRVKALADGVGPGGKPLPDHPIVSKTLGNDTADRTARRITEQIDKGEFDYLGDKPVDQYIWEQSNADLEALGDDKFKRAGYAQALKPYIDEQVKKQAEVREADRVNRGKDAFFSSLGMTLNQTKAEGINDADGKYAAIQKTRKALQDGPLHLNIPKQEFDNQMIAFADKIADDDDPEVAKLAVKILSDPRGGIGPIGFKQENLNKSIEITKRAAASINKAETRIVTDKLSDAALTAGLGGANLNDLNPDQFLTPKDTHSDGTPMKITKEDLQKAVFDKWRMRSSEQAARLKETPEQTIKREVSELSSMGLTNPVWKDTFKSFASGLGDGALQDPQKMQAAQGVLTLYDNLRGQKPFFLERHLDKDSAKLLDLYWVARNRLSDPNNPMPQDQALQLAIKAVDPASQEEYAPAIDFVKKKIEKEYDNGSQYAAILKETAMGYARLGKVSGQQAIDLATERLKAKGANVNGNYVPIPLDANGNQLPVLEDFADVAEKTVDNWVENHLPPEAKASDYTLRGYPNGTYEIVNKRTGITPIGINLGSGGTAVPQLTLKDFIDTKNREDAKKLSSDVHESNINAVIRSNDYNKAMDMIGGGSTKPATEGRGPKGSRVNGGGVEIMPFLNMLTRKAFWMSGGHNPKDLLGNPGGGPLGKSSKDSGGEGKAPFLLVPRLSSTQ